MTPGSQGRLEQCPSLSAQCAPPPPPPVGPLGLPSSIHLPPSSSCGLLGLRGLESGGYVSFLESPMAVPSEHVAGMHHAGGPLPPVPEPREAGGPADRESRGTGDIPPAPPRVFQVARELPVGLSVGGHSHCLGARPPPQTSTLGASRTSPHPTRAAENCDAWGQRGGGV